MTRTIRMKDIAGLKANTTTAPYATTEPAKIGGVRGGDVTPGDTQATLFFSDDFDAQADWNGAINPTAEQYADSGDVIPTGWDAARSTGGWSPSTGYPSGKESVYIKGGADFTRGGTGKAFVAYRFGRETASFWGDSILAKILPTGTKKVFCRFWIKFQPGWSNRGLSKLFRIQGWDEGNNMWASDSLRPGVIWDFEQYNYGSRLNLARRAEDSDDFYFTDPPMTNTRLDGSLHWAGDTYDLNDDGIQDNNPQLINQQTMQVIPNEPLADIDHSEIMGTAWHKMEFYVGMNSAPGEQDGVLAIWMDDQLIHRNLDMPWIQNGGNPNKDWRLVKLGGNDSFDQKSDGVQILDSEEITEWYAIDDLEIYTGGLPEGMSWL